MAERVKLRARDLRPGDLLLGSNRTVDRVYTRPHPDVPVGKILIHLKGECGFRTWNASTTITVKRELSDA